MNCKVSLDDSENDCVLKGRELRAAVSEAGMRVAQKAKEIYGNDAYFLERAVGLLARTILCKAGEKGSATPEMGNKILLIITYFQGCGFTERLIAEGQYAKAAAALKQDFEILTRIKEIDAGEARSGRTPQMRHAPKGSPRLYGELNKVAHPSNEVLLHRHLDQIVKSEIRGVSPLPVFRESTLRGEFKLHCWLCYSICHASVQVLLENYGEDDVFVVDCITRFAQLQDSGLASGILIAFSSESEAIQ
ncbi:MAG: hypothetical protein P4K83_06310 [Terracidiphilus sp.]|nr:hypothetical protein [Terracidiphilus sp.]